MNTFIRFHLVVAIAILLSGCGQNRNKSREIGVTWELLSNIQGEKPTATCIITITNKGRNPLDSNWVLYFNQSPRRILDAGDPSIGTVVHINGDWYQLTPSSNLSIDPGDKVRFSYEAEYWFTKETDAPMGLYFVFTDKKGKERIIEVSDYTIIPFTRPEQIRRHTGDYTPLPTPENDYKANQGLHLLNKDQLHRVIPSPTSITANGDSVELHASLDIFYAENDLEFEANYLKHLLKSLLGWDCAVQMGTGITQNAVLLTTNSTIGNGESYSLEVLDKGIIQISGSSPAGVFYGIQSLIGLIPIEDLLSPSHRIEIPKISINDSPRFGYRGVHLDVVRHFMPKETIKKTIDILAYYKINTLHLHLTDDEGWRLEISTLPELTSVGAQRGHTTKSAAALHPAYGSGPHPFDKGKNSSGFYTKQDYIELLKYANERHIIIIPEINLPGHARAAIKSMEVRYQYFVQKGDSAKANEFRLIDPKDESVYLSAQYYTDNIVNVARESTYTFLETVIDEIIEIYGEANAPLTTIHIGGDEVPQGAWEKSPMAQELMKQLSDIKHFENLHAYFTERALENFNRKGLKMAGWEEIALHTNNGHVVNPKFACGNVIPYVWNNLWGSQDLAYRLANRGYPVVLCHVTNFYCDLAYSNHPKEPGLYWGGFVNTFSAWHYSPFDVFKTTLKDNMGRQIDVDKEYAGMERLKPDAQKNIIGLQAQLWSETIQNHEMLEYRLLPKLIGFAQTAWGKEREWETMEDKLQREALVTEDWNIFANTIAQKELPRLSRLFGGYGYRVPPPGAKIEDNQLFSNVAFPGLTIRYTADGSEPNQHSPEYTSPLKVDDRTFRLKAFDMADGSSRTVEIKSNGDESNF
ncbi:MAG: family 20 glycosylhydrolase [Tenuifilaceae bacterium]|jgi:hexosaminidase|nr:family 20 glycosylhydrolase [Tenuifilaceae bacterium]